MRAFRRLQSGALLVLLAAVFIFQAYAQEGLEIRAYPPIVTDFPSISINLNITDTMGQRIASLRPDDFSILEDDTIIDDLALEVVELGTRQVFVINTNADLRVRDTVGRSRYDLIRNALINWWRLPDASLLDRDDLSLLTQEGTLVQHTSSSAELASALNAFEPDFRADGNGYGLLLEALTFLYDAPQSDAPSFLLFATPLLPYNAELPVENIIAQANENGTAIFPILLTETADPELPEVATLLALANGTGGRVIFLDPALGLDDLATQILEFRTAYQLSYRSAIQTSGEHQLQVIARVEDQELSSELQPFTVSVQPPEVTFIQPPAEILRASEDTALPLTAYPPTSQQINVLIQFPDGYARQIIRSTLLVNGEVVAENVQAPFDTFSWDLSDVLEPGSYRLQVRVEDELGLEAETITHRVELDVELPPSGLAALGPALTSLITVFALIAAGIASVTVLVSWIRRRQASSPTQPHNTSPAVMSSRRSRLLQETLQAPIEAHLVRPGDEGASQNWIPLTGAALHLGSDPSMAPYPLSDPSVSGLHANIKRNAGGDYVLRDQGSKAGTWVNHVRIDQDGCQLHHGDRIHLGLVELRFLFVDPPNPRRIESTPTPEAPLASPPTGSSHDSI